MTVAIATLSSEGWVTTPIRKLDRALTYALTTDALQSNIYRGNLTSLQAIIQETLDDEQALQSKANNKLNDYFSRIFDIAHVQVIVEEFPAEGSNRLALRIKIEAIDNGEAVTADSLAYFEKGIFSKVVDLNNHGTSR